MSKTATTNASRETFAHPVGPLLINVRLPEGRGVLRVGDMVPGKTYQHPADEAIRLVESKGFHYATDTDAQLAAEHVIERNAVAIAQAEETATAAGDGGGTPTTQTAE